MDNTTWQRMKTLPKFKMNHKIVKEIEEELKIKNKKKSKNKNLSLMLILTGIALSTIAITMGIYKIHKKRTDDLISSKSAKKELEKQKKIVFTRTSD